MKSHKTKLKGLAAAVDKAHREHKGKPHPKTIKYKGKTVKLGK